MITQNEPVSKLLDHAPLRVSVAATGAGAGIQKRLWDVPGISAVLVEASFPYAPEATDSFLRFKPSRYCSALTAMEMAMECYYSAWQPGGPKAIGVGLCASVASLKHHRGEHRIFAAWFSDHGCRIYERVLEKSSEPAVLARLLDGAVADSIGVLALLEAVGEPMNLAPEAKSYDGSPVAAEAFWSHPMFMRDGSRCDVSTVEVEALFPGAFNPPHHGHFGMAAAFRTATRLEPTFHITAVTPHKAPLGIAEMLQRAKLLEGYNRMFTMNDPLYLDKAMCFPGRPILIGVDALERMLDPQWGVPPEILGSEFARLGTQFYVPETRTIRGREIRMTELVLPVGLVVNPISGSWNISSSDLRATSVSS